VIIKLFAYMKEGEALILHPKVCTFIGKKVVSSQPSSRLWSLFKKKSKFSYVAIPFIQPRIAV